MRKVLLVILDGWGHSDFEGSPWEGNAVELADVPRFRALYDEHPRSRLLCSGRDVGLPEGQMGNSEVGHLNLGAGRVVPQDIVRVDDAIADGTLRDRLGLEEIVQGLLDKGRTLHLVGLVSDGGVHSHIRHLVAILDDLPHELTVRVHCLTDGRDTSPTGGVDYLRTVREACDASPNWAIATVIGRYYAMDRDKRWARTKRAYDCMVAGESEAVEASPDFLAQRYAEGVTDEFVPPAVMEGAGTQGMHADDAVILFNFRADRMRQITAALSMDDFDDFVRQGERPRTVVTMTEYEPDFPVQVAFPPQYVKGHLTEVLARGGDRVLKVAETEKYAHVTYFFNGGSETALPGEDRTLIPSPGVATYDQQPEMSAQGVADAVAMGLRSGDYTFILVNFANPDMVGHTGSIPAAVKAVEAVDGHLGRLLDLVTENPEWVALVTADHGNCEYMLNPDGSPHTAHTTQPVDFIVYDPKGGAARVADGRLADVAPTVLGLMRIPLPDEMTGTSLLELGETLD